MAKPKTTLRGFRAIGGAPVDRNVTICQRRGNAVCWLWLSIGVGRVLRNRAYHLADESTGHFGSGLTSAAYHLWPQSSTFHLGRQRTRGPDYLLLLGGRECIADELLLGGNAERSNM